MQECRHARLLGADIPALALKLACIPSTFHYLKGKVAVICRCCATERDFLLNVRASPSLCECKRKHDLDVLLEVLGARGIFFNDQACKKGSELSPMCGLSRGAAVMGMCRWCQGKLAFRLGVSKQVHTLSHAVLILLWHSALNDPMFPVSSARCKTNYSHLLSFLKAQGHLAVPIVLRGRYMRCREFVCSCCVQHFNHSGHCALPLPRRACHSCWPLGMCDLCFLCDIVLLYENREKCRWVNASCQDNRSFFCMLWC